MMKINVRSYEEGAFRDEKIISSRGLCDMWHGLKGRANFQLEGGEDEGYSSWKQLI